MNPHAALHAYINQHLPRFREELFGFLRIPSVSAHLARTGAVREAALWCRDHVGALGLNARLQETRGHPLVIADWQGAGPDAATVLVYGHYDVQPPEPLERWTTPPFQPQLRGGRICARGAVDDKGQLFMHLKALEAHVRTAGRLPVNVILLLEGEEETGSAGVIAYLRDQAQLPPADAVLISDTAMWTPERPAIIAALRGTVYAEVTIRRPGGDLHSGTYGGAVLNPANALGALLASFHDQDARVTVDGFYDDVDGASDLRDRIRQTPFDLAAFERDAGTSALGGEAGHGILERLWLRPTLDVHGILAGYTGVGPKTVLPSEASAKVSCRLVASQQPTAIAELLRRHVHDRVDPRLDVAFTVLSGTPPWRADLSAPLFGAAAALLKRHFGHDPLFVGDGGSIGVVPALASALDAPVLLLGFGLPGSNEHAPDEWLSAALFERGIHVLTDLLACIPKRASVRVSRDGGI